MSNQAANSGAGLEAHAATARGASANLPDRELAERVLAGSREHFDRLFDALFPRVQGYVDRHLDDCGKAQDLTEVVLSDVVASLPAYRGDVSLLAWSFGITRSKLARR